MRFEGRGGISGLHRAQRAPRFLDQVFDADAGSARGSGFPSAGRHAKLWVFMEMRSAAQGAVLLLCSVPCTSTPPPVH